VTLPKRRKEPCQEASSFSPGEHGKDSRTYRVSFARILSELKDYYKPEWDLDRGGQELVEMFRRVGFKEEHFRGRMCSRLQQLHSPAGDKSHRPGYAKGSMKFIEQKLPGVFLIQPTPFEDERGIFRRHFCAARICRAWNCS
jgi:hypothetical protein